MVKFKVVMYGEFGVGKTTLIMRLFRNEFFSRTQSTIGASFMSWRPPNDPEMYMGIWDTAGQERFNTLLPMYLRGSHVVVNCVEYGEPFDEEKAAQMYEIAKLHSPKSMYYIVQTKTDKRDTPELQKDPEIEKFAKEKGITKILYTSSKTGEGVIELFEDIAKELKTIPEPKDLHSLHLERTANNNTIKRYFNCC